MVGIQFVDALFWVDHRLQPMYSISSVAYLNVGIRGTFRRVSFLIDEFYADLFFKYIVNK